MRIFVSGATGVIGKRVIPRLVAAGHRVSALARSPDKKAALTRMGAEAAAASLFDAGALRTAVAAAAQAAGAERLIPESFAPMYEPRGDEWIDETAPVRPARYNRTSLDAEASAERFTRGGGAGIVLRFAYFYGPDSDFTRDTIRFARKGWAATFGPADGFIPSVSHDDAAAAVMAALGVRAGIYNVVDDEPMRCREYFDTLAAVLAVAPPELAPAWASPRAGSVGEILARSQRISNRKLRSECGWAPRYPSIREGFRAVVASGS